MLTYIKLLNEKLTIDGNATGFLRENNVRIRFEERKIALNLEFFPQRRLEKVEKKESKNHRWHWRVGKSPKKIDKRGYSLFLLIEHTIPSTEFAQKPRIPKILSIILIYLQFCHSSKTDARRSVTDSIFLGLILTINGNLASSLCLK